MSAPHWAIPAPSLQTQLLTEERVAWIYNVSPRTVRDWRRQRKLPCLKMGKNIVRYQPSDVARHLLAHYRNAERPPPVGITGPEDPVWQQIERLIETAVDSRLAAGAPRMGRAAR